MQIAGRSSLQYFPMLLLNLLSFRYATSLSYEALWLILSGNHGLCAAQLVGIFVMSHACTAGIYFIVLLFLLLMASGKDDG